jgi:transposase-like protein
MKKLIAAVTTAGLLIVGTAGIAQAAESPGTSSSTKAPASAAAGTGRRAAALRLAASTIGIEPKALLEAIMGGQSVADVARSHNVDPQKVIDAVVTAADKKVDAAVAAGKIDATRAAELKDRIPQRVTKLANGNLKERGRHRVERATLRRHARRAGAVVAAGVIGIEPKALAEALKGGQSVADVARSHNVDPQKVIDAVVTAANKKVDAAVAAGKVKAERAAKLKDRLDERITKLVNATPRVRTPAS